MSTRPNAYPPDAQLYKTSPKGEKIIELKYFDVSRYQSSKGIGQGFIFYRNQLYDSSVEFDGDAHPMLGIYTRRSSFPDISSLNLIAPVLDFSNPGQIDDAPFFILEGGDYMYLWATSKLRVSKEGYAQ